MGFEFHKPADNVSGQDNNIELASFTQNAAIEQSVVNSLKTGQIDTAGLRTLLIGEMQNTPVDLGSIQQMLTRFQSNINSELRGSPYTISFDNITSLPNHQYCGCTEIRTNLFNAGALARSAEVKFHKQ